MPTTSNTYQLEAEGIPVTVTRKRVRRLNLRVRPDGSAAMSVPWRVGRTEAQAFLDAHASWLKAAVDRAQRRTAQQKAAAQQASDGTVMLWGEKVAAPADGDVCGLYRREVASRLPEVAARMEATLGVRAAGWQLRDMTSRWGSCTPKTARIRINVRLAAYPPTCLDYVVAHELAHLLEPSHNARFHAIVARAYPNEKQARAFLRQSPL